VILVGYRTLDGVFPFHLLVTYLLAAFRLRTSVNEFVNKLSVTMERVLRITNLQEFFATRPLIRDSRQSVKIDIKGRIEIRDVSFSYPGTNRTVLKNISLQIKEGETIALVGPNGGGKTTLVKLLTRLYEPTSGSITIDGIQIQEITLDSLQSQIAYIDQNDVRFEATVHENIAYGDWRRLMSRKDLVEAIAEEVSLTEMIRHLPNGMDTVLGRVFGDFDLSGGQWQKIAIARALATDASIYILDEPTAHMDAQTEFEIFQGLRNLVTRKTTVLISHRFTTARMADRIVVLDEGRIVEEGSHDSLLSLGGVYGTLFELHQSTFSS
jgi:ATP-binding cassette subfamily B protein